MIDVVAVAETVPIVADTSSAMEWVITPDSTPVLENDSEEGRLFRRVNFVARRGDDFSFS